MQVKPMQIAAALLLTGLALAGSPAGAQSPAEYPAKTVKLIVPNAPGGPVDSLARIMGAAMETRFKRPFVVENRTGASGQIASEFVARSPADGYTLLVIAQPVVFEQATNKGWPLKIDRDLMPITIFAGSGYTLVVPATLPVNNLRELVAYSIANPNKLNEGHPGGFNADIALLERAMKMGPIQAIPYAGSAPAIQALLAGDIHLLGTTPLTVRQFEKTGKIKVLAYTGRQRHSMLPAVPTVSESNVGLNDFEAGLWVSMIGPANLPAEVVNKLYATSSDSLKSADVLGKLDNVGWVPMDLPPAQARARMLALLKDYQDAVAAGVRLR